MNSTIKSDVLAHDYWFKRLSKVKRQPSEWEKIIANEATDKQLISKMIIFYDYRKKNHNKYIFNCFESIYFSVFLGYYRW